MASSALVSGALPVTTESWKASSSSLKALAYEMISLMLRDLDVPDSPSMISTVAGALRRNGDGKLRVTRSCGP